MRSRSFRLVLLLAALGPLGSSGAVAGSIVFDFDTGTPVLDTGRNVPFDQTAAAVTAHFSSPDGAAFSVQSANTTFLNLSTFSAKYLMANDQNRSALDILFSRPVTSVTLKFATIEYHDPGQTPSNIEASAYQDTVGGPPLGSALTHGANIPGDTFPQGTLTLDLGGVTFNLVRIVVPFQPGGATGFLADDVEVRLPVPPGAGAVPDGARVPGVPLTVARTPAGALRLAWSASCRATDVDYAIYEGWILSYPTHTPVQCSTSGALEATIWPADGDTYYLVVPNNGTDEGSYGTDQAGTERAPSTSACLPQRIAPCP